MIMAEQIRMNNFGVVEGIAEEIVRVNDVRWTDARTGGQKEAKSLNFNIRVGTEDEYQSVPVQMFVNKTKKDGTVSVAYTSLEQFLTQVKTIANSSPEEASKVRTGYGTITMNEFYGNNGQLVSSPEFSASFLNIIDGATFNPRAEGNLELAVVNVEQEVDQDGVETGTLLVQGVNTDGWSAELITLKATEPNIVNGLSQVLEVGKVYEFYVDADFSIEVIEIEEESLIGPPVVKTRTVRTRNLIITNVLEGSLDMTEEQIKEVLDKRQVRLDKDKARSQARKQETKAETNTAEMKKPNFGF